MIAGLEVMRIINEPTAAAIAYGLDKKVRTGLQQRPAVFRTLSVTACLSLETLPNHALPHAWRA